VEREREKEWTEFSSTWEDLGSDTYIADKGTYRKRRFSSALYNSKSSVLNYKKHECYFQDKENNTLNGGVERYFDPITPHIAYHPILVKLIRSYSDLFTALGYGDKWHLSLHQVRITASPDQVGNPSPEGIHKDGTTFTTLLLMDRKGVKGGENLVYDNDKKLTESKTLENPGDFIILSDEDLYHDVNPIKPVDNFGYRDMLMVGFTSI